MSKKLTKSNDFNFRQANNFIESRFSDFSLVELKAIEFLASQTKRADIEYINNKMDKVINVRLLDLAKLLEIQSEHLYKETGRIVDSLFNKQASFKFHNESGKIVYRSSRFVNNIDYSDGVFSFRVNYEVLNYFVDVEREYTRINLKYIAALDSTYSIKIYKLLKQYANIEKRTFDLQELKLQLGIIDSYKEYCHFKQRVIVPAIEKINLSTDIQVEFTEIKVGKKVEEIEFKISSVPKIKSVK